MRMLLCLLVVLALAALNLTQFGLAQLGATTTTNTASKRPSPSSSTPLIGSVSPPSAFFDRFMEGEQRQQPLQQQQQQQQNQSLGMPPLSDATVGKQPLQQQARPGFASLRGANNPLLGNRQRPDQSVDSNLATESLILASDYKYEIHESISEDGYITKLVRLINPRLERHTKQLPVVIYGGQFATPALFVLGRQQRPIQWPLVFTRNSKMYNRSLAFALGDNGYDVWLVPARGVDRNNRARIDPEQIKWLESISPSRNGLPRTAPNYWDFGIDEIIQFEFQNQLELVSRITEHERLSLITYSSGATVAFGYAASHREYALAHIDSLVAIGPSVYSNINNNLLLTAHSLYGSLLSASSLPLVGENSYFVDILAKNGLSSMCGSFLQPVCRILFEKMFGPSEMSQSYMESKLLDCIARPQSTKSIQHQSQISKGHEFRRFDYGAYRNKMLYRQEIAPRYPLDRIEISRIFLFSGDKDRIADDEATEKLKHDLDDRVGLVILKDYNHLDLIAAWDVDARLNQPIMKLLDSRDTALSGVSLGDHPLVEVGGGKSTVPTTNSTATTTKGESSRLAEPKKKV